MSTGALRWEDLPHYTYEDYVQWEGQWDRLEILNKDRCFSTWAPVRSNSISKKSLNRETVTGL